MVWASEGKSGFDRTEASAAAFGSAVYQAFVVIPPERANAWQLAHSFLHILHVSSKGMFLFCSTILVKN